jgi:AcrR family transcriptional regulator
MPIEVLESVPPVRSGGVAARGEPDAPINLDRNDENDESDGGNDEKDDGNTTLLGAADPEAAKALKKRARSAKAKRNAAMRQEAAKDKRRYKTRSKLFVAYIRLVRDRSERPPGKLITVSEVCAKAGVSEAAFFKNFSTSTSVDVGGIHRMMLATADRVSAIVSRQLRREVRERLEEGAAVSRIERVTLAATLLVVNMVRYPHLFHVEGVLPREVIYSLSDPLAEAIIWDDAASPEQRAEAVDIAKYHTTAIVGIMRSSLGKDVPPDRYTDRVVYVLLSQLIPALLLEGEPETVEDQQPSVLDNLRSAVIGAQRLAQTIRRGDPLAGPVEMRYPTADGYQRLETLLRAD